MRFRRKRNRRNPLETNEKKVSLPYFPLPQLPNELLTEVFSKMKYSSFIKSRMSCHWIHDFIEAFRRQIHVQYHCKDAVIFPNGIGLHWSGYNKVLLPIRELMAIRPKTVTIFGCFQGRRVNELVYWKPNKIPRAIAIMRKLGWLKAEIKLNHLKENELLTVCDGILKYGIPPELEISDALHNYSVNVSQHPLLSLVPSVTLYGFNDVDYSFILGNHTKIGLRCENICTFSVNKLIKNIVSCSVSTEQVRINFYWDEQTPVFDEILEGLSPTLLWSKETQENSILSKKIKHFDPPDDFLYYKFDLADGRIGVLRIYVIEYANIVFSVFPNQKALIKQLKESGFLYSDL